MQAVSWAGQGGARLAVDVQALQHGTGILLMECNTLIVCAHHTAHTYVVPKVPDGVFTECCASCTHTNTHHMKRSILTSSCRCSWRCGLTLQIVPKITPIAVLHGHTGRRETLSHTHTHARTHACTRARMHAHHLFTLPPTAPAQ